MTLETGQRLSGYEVLGPLGAGGMGEVYRALDTRLDREVALKILQEEFTANPDRLRRFEREAKVLASLNHPNVAAIYGVDQLEGTSFLVLELVPGASLEERLSRGALPLDDALALCLQIATGLEAAHEAGIVHRDLKPANVQVTPTGVVKVLDFGLAKPQGFDPASGSTTGPQKDSFVMTEEGVVLGTPTYMSPEQARGRTVDRRTDVWAFGCVLYECLTGRRAFGGHGFSDIVAGILEREPDWSALPARTPPHVRQLLRRCLVKDAPRRLRDIGEARLVLSSEPSAVATETRPEPISSRGFSLAGWAVVLAAVGFGSWGWFRGEAALPASGPGGADDARATRFVIDFGSERYVPGDGIYEVAVSPDGRRVAASVRVAGVDGLHVRELDELESRRLEHTEWGRDLTFGPDGRRLLYKNDALHEVSIDEGRPRSLASWGAAVGFAWMPDGRVFFVPGWGRGIALLPEAGEDPVDVIVPDPAHGEHGFLTPRPLHGSGKLLYAAWTLSGWEQSRIHVFDPESGEQKLVLEGGSNPAYVPLSEGHGALIYAVGRELWARRFELDELACQGEPIRIVNRVDMRDSTGQINYDVSPAGTLAYVTANVGSTPVRLMRIERDGSRAPALEEINSYADLTVDRRGRRAVVEVAGPVFRLFSFELDLPVPERSLRRVVLEADAEQPRLSPDGRRLALRSNHAGSYQTYVLGMDSSELRRIGDSTSFVQDWTPDGDWLAVWRAPSGSGPNVHLLRTDGSGLERPLIQGRGEEGGAAFSPDGRWLAYLSDETGRQEVYVVAHPGGDRRVQVSRGGGGSPFWSTAGDELHYQKDGKLYGARAEPVGEGLRFERPEELFESYHSWSSGGGGIQALPDGSFLALEPQMPGPAALRLVVVEGLDRELRRKLALADPDD